MKAREEKATRREAVWSPQTGQAPVRSLAPFQTEGKPLETSLQEPGMVLYILKRWFWQEVDGHGTKAQMRGHGSLDEQGRWVGGHRHVFKTKWTELLMNWLHGAARERGFEDGSWHFGCCPVMFL